nr:GEVED domain-containing protein [Candidatus Anammoximicrobium sp.]
DPPDTLAALTKVPTSVENGLYANVLIAIERDGTMFAFFGRNTNNWNGDPAADFTQGSPAPIFVNGNSVVDTGITSVTGLAFSSLQKNLWHTTSDRWSDDGHGIAGVPGQTSDDPVFDNSRASREGMTSLFFGIEDPNDNWPNNLLYRARTETGGERAPGGAHGTLISQPFNLKGYSPEDRPVLYFNYYLDTERENSELYDTDMMQDSFRVYVAGDDGIWAPLATNNAARVSRTIPDDEFDFGYYVQPLFDISESSAPNSWRQARIALSPFAGQENLRLRFEFSTAGGENLGHAQTTGDELYAVPGTAIRDGDTFTIGSSVFEFDMGYTIVTPTGANLTNGETFTITNGTTQTFTFVDTVTGPRQILIAGTDSADDVATKVRTALLAQWGTLAIYRDGNRLNIPGVTNATASAGLPASFLEGAPGVGAAVDQRVFVHAGMPAYDANNTTNRTLNNDVRAQIVNAMAAEFNVPGQDGSTGYLNLNTVKTHNQIIHVIGRKIGASGPLGWARQDATTTGLTGDQFGLSYTGAAPDYDWNEPGTAANFSPARQGMNNAIQGVYIDDIIIGFAERGEMVTRAAPDATGFVANDSYLQPSSPTPRGSYQVELRRSASYLSMDAFDQGQIPFHSRSFDTNDRLAQQVTFVAPAGYEIADGQTFVLSDGIDTMTFEYDDLDLRDRVNVEDTYAGMPFETHQVTVGGFFNINVPYPMPSPTVAVGNDRVLGMANTSIQLFDKSGGTLTGAVDLRTFFPNEQGGYVPGPLQPSAIYDRYSDRFIVIATDSNAFGNLSNPILGSQYLLIAVSKTGTPTGLNAADWHFYSIPTTYNFGAGNSGIYYPKLATDADSLYITGNYFHLTNNSAQGTIVTRLEKTATTLLGGVLGTRADVVATTVLPELPAMGLFPVQSIGRAASDPQLFVDVNGPNGIRVWEMNDANTLSVAQALNAPFTWQSNDAPQGGSAATLQTLQSVMTTAVWRNDSLWTAHTINVGGEATVHWYEVSTTAGAYGIRQQGNIDPGVGLWTFLPGINVDAAGNMAITYTQTSASTYPAMMVAGREATAALGYTEPGEAVAISSAPFDLDYSVTIPFGPTYTIFPAGGSEYWGDAAGLVLDPFDDTTFWAIGEYASSHATYGAQWNTRFAKFNIGPSGLNSAEGVAEGNVQVPFRVGMRDDQIAEAIRDAVNSAAVQAVLEIRAGLSDGRSKLGNTASTSNLVNLYGNAMANRYGSTQFGDVDKTAGAGDVLVFGRDIPTQNDTGDQNIHREQGQIVIHSNTISNSRDWGIIVDAGVRNNTQYGDIVPRAGDDLPHNGPVRNLRTPNSETWAPGVVVSNNVVASGRLGGILFSGDNTGTQAPPVPFGRIVNNTVYGRRAADDIGIQVNNNAGPTLLNNVVANLSNGIIVDGTSSTTVVGATLYWNNAFNAGGIPGGGLGDFPILATTSPFVNAAAGNFYPAATSPLIDSSVPNLADRTTFVDTKTPHALGVFDPATGRYSSQIVAPTTDVTGQLRVDDPAVDTPPAQAKQSIVDRGAVDRADLFSPTAELLTPLDNDVEGRDRDPNPTVVHVYDNTLTNFKILLSDGNGMGIDSSSVTSNGVTLTQNGVLLSDGVQYTFGFNATANQILLTTLSEIWEPNAVYQITLNNRDRTVIEAQDGSYAVDGDRFRITDAGGTTVTFEYESGYSLQVPQTRLLQIRDTGAALDGATLTVNDGTGDQKLEFDLDGGGLSDPSHKAVVYAASDDLDDIAEKLIDVIDAIDPLGDLTDPVGNGQFGWGLHPRSLGGGYIHLGTSSVHTNIAVSGAMSLTGVTAGVEEGQSFRMVWDGATYVFEFDSGDGVSVPGNIPVAFSSFQTHEELAENVAAAIRRQSGLGLSTASHVGDGLVHVGGQAGLVISVIGSALSRLGDPGVATGNIAVRFVPGYGFRAELMAGAIINAINAAPFGASASLRAGSTLFVQGISGSAAVNDVDGTFKSVFDAVGIKDRAGNWLAANQSSAETQFTIILGDVEVDYGDLPDVNYKTLLASNGARHIILPDSPYLGVAIDADPNGRPGTNADGDDADARLDTGSSVLTAVPTGPHTLQVPANGAAGITDNVSSFTVTDADGHAVWFVFDLNGAGGTPVGSQPLVYFGTEPAEVLQDLIIAALAAEVTKGTLAGVSAAVSDGVSVRIDGAASVTIAGAGLTLLNRLPASLNVPAGAFGAANDGTTFTVYDGVSSLTFEFEEINTVNNGLTNLNHYPVRFNSATATAASVAVGIRAAIEAAVAEGRLENLLATAAGTQVQIDYDEPWGAAGDDEDGVAFLGKLNRFSGATTLLVTASGPGLLDGWIDFNRNLLFDATEQVFKSVPVFEGQNYLTVTTPAWANAGTAYARFRISLGGQLPTSGLAIGGEVEDYRVQILPGSPPNAVNDGGAAYTISEDLLREDPSVPYHFATKIWANDLAFAGSTIVSAILVDPPRYARPGSFRLNPDGTFDYYPVKDYNRNVALYDTFTYRAVDNAGLTSNLATVTITVNPTNDAPGIDLSALATTPAGRTVDEDDPAGLTFTGLRLHDAADEAYDPLQVRQVTLAVEHGVLTLATTSGLTLSADRDGDGTPDLDVDGDGDVDGDDTLAAQTGAGARALVMQGTIADLNSALGGLVYHSDLNFTTDIAPEQLIVEINDLGYTDQLTAAHVPTDGQAMIARATVTLTVQTKNDAPVIAVPGNLNVTIDEDDPDGLLLVDDSGTPSLDISVSDVDDLLAPPILVQVTAEVLYGGLVLGNDAGLEFDVDGDGFDDRLPAAWDGVEPLVGGTYQRLVFRGTIADVNAALATLQYYGDADFNTGTFAEVLMIEVNDLGNRDVDTPAGNTDPDVSTALRDVAWIQLTVNPVNDPPTITIPALLPAAVEEETTTGLLLEAPASETPRWITVDDVDDIHDPAAIQLQVTLHVSHGGLVLGNTAGLEFDVDGDGLDDRVPAMVPPDDMIGPVVPGTYQTLEFVGTIADLNAALATLTYYGDIDFTGADVLEITVDDLGNTGGGALSAYEEHTIFVGGINDPPTVTVPPAQTVSEDGQLVFSKDRVPPNAITVDDIDVLEAPGELLVRVSVSNGTLTLPDVAGLTFPLDIDGDGLSDDADLSGVIEADEVAGLAFRQITMYGIPDDLNEALEGMIYQANPNFNGTDTLVVVVNDQGYTGIGPVPSLDVVGVVTITVAPVNDEPTLTVPGQRNGWEDTDLSVAGI